MLVPWARRRAQLDFAGQYGFAVPQGNFLPVNFLPLRNFFPVDRMRRQPDFVDFGDGVGLSFE